MLQKDYLSNLSTIHWLLSVDAPQGLQIALGFSDAAGMNVISRSYHQLGQKCQALNMIAGNWHEQEWKRPGKRLL